MSKREFQLTIGLDARTVHRAVRRGTGKNLIDLYGEVLRLRPGWRVIGYHRGPQATPLAHPRYLGRQIDMPGDRVDAWRRWRLPLAAGRDKVDLLHCPANEAPPSVPCPIILTVHDLLPLRSNTRAGRALGASVKRAVARSQTIITPSQFTADALVDRFDADPRQIVVNHWAADRGMTYVEPSAERDATCGKYGASSGYVLHLGASDPRKNTANAIRGYAKLADSARRSWPLVVIGLSDPEHRAEMARLCRELGVAGDVKLNGFADEADMPGLFSGAAVLLYPSHWEGFGLPIVDAWAARTAVVTADATSLPEVGGDAASYVDPNNPDDITERLTALLFNDAAREDMVRDGLARLAQFTWQRTAERFIDAVERSVAQSKESDRAAA